MGRPRKPIEQHLRDGTFRRDRHGSPPIEPDPPGPPPDRPEGLGEAVAAKWDEVMPLVAGVVRPRDVPAMVVLATWLTLADRTAGAVEVMDPADKRYAQTLTCYAIATDKILTLSSRFGLTPSDRAKLHAALPKTAPAKPRVRTRPQTAFDDMGPPEHEE